MTTDIPDPIAADRNRDHMWTVLKLQHKIDVLARAAGETHALSLASYAEAATERSRREAAEQQADQAARALASRDAEIARLKAEAASKPQGSGPATDGELRAMWEERVGAFFTFGAQSGRLLRAVYNLGRSSRDAEVADRDATIADLKAANVNGSLMLREQSNALAAMTERANEAEQRAKQFRVDVIDIAADRAKAITRAEAGGR